MAISPSGMDYFSTTPEDVVITDEEIAFMKRRCSYIPGWFYTYLKGYRFCREWVKVRQDARGICTWSSKGVGPIPSCWK